MGFRKRLGLIIAVSAMGLFLMITAHNSGGKFADNYDDQEKTPEEIHRMNHLSMIDPETYSDMEGLSAKKGMKLAIIAENRNTPFWEEVRKGAKDAVKDANKMLGYKGKDKISLEFTSSKDRDIDDQVNLFDVVMGDNPSAIAVAMLDIDAFATQFDIASENGIAVLCCETQSNNDNVRSYIGEDNHLVGKECAEKMAELLGEGESSISVYSSSIVSYDKQREDSYSAGSDNLGFKNAYTVHIDAINDDLVAAFGPEEGDEDESIDAPESESSEQGEKYAASEEKRVQEQNGAVANTSVSQKGQEEDKTADEEDSDDGQKDKSDEKNGTVAEYIVRAVSSDDTIRAVYCADLNATDETIDAIDSIINGEDEALDIIEETDRAEVISRVKSLKIIGFIGGKKSYNELVNGRIEQAVLQNPYAIGYATVIAQLRTVLSEGNSAFIDCGYLWVDKTNADTIQVTNLLFE